jgi:hypothetical protein
LVLIIGGRYGSPRSGETKPEGQALEQRYKHYNSVTVGEYRKASGVAAEYETFKKNRTNESIDYAHVDSINVFRLLDEIGRQSRNNVTRVFDRYDDIESWLRDQWAGLFANFLHHRSEQKALSYMAAQLQDLEHITKTLKKYSEAILRGTRPDEGKDLVDEQARRDREYRLDRFLKSDDADEFASWGGVDSRQVFEALEDSRSAEEFFKRLGFELDEDGDWTKMHPEGDRGLAWPPRRYHELVKEYLSDST